MPKPAPKRRMHDLTALTVGLVDSAANRRKFAIKRSESDRGEITMPKKIQELLDEENETVDAASFTGLSEDDAVLTRAAARLYLALPPAARKTVATLAGDPMPALAPPQNPLDSIVRADGSIDESKVPAEMRPFALAHAAEVQRRKAIETELATIKRARQVDEVRRRAKDSFRHVGSTDKVANLLLLADDAGLELKTALGEVLAEAEGRLKTGDTLAVRGRTDNTTDPDSGEPTDMLEGLIKREMAAGKSRLQATETVVRANPGLYAQHSSKFSLLGAPADE